MWGNSASFDCRVPGFSCIFAHAHGWWQGEGIAETQKRIQGGMRKKVEGISPPKEQSQLYLVSLKRDRNPGNNSHDRVG